MNYQLVSAIRKGTWAIDPKHAMDNLGLVVSLLEGKVEIERKEESKDPVITAATRKAYTFYGWEDAPDGSVAVITITGELFKRSQFCGPIGMADIGQRIKQADSLPNISSILLVIDSPGGTVDGTQTLGQIVKQTQKPIIALVDGLMASAALWIGSSADEVYASTPMDEVGSIGVLLSFADLQPAYEKMGVKFHTVTADQSMDKTKMFEDLRAGKYDDYKKNFLNPLAELFINTVKENRPNVKDSQLTGKVFFARDAVGSLIDGIKSLDEAIARAEELGTEFTSKSNTSKQMKKFAFVNKTLGVDALESVEDTVSLNEAQIESLDNALSAGEKAAADLVAANASKDKAVQDLADANQKAVDDMAAKDALVSQLTTENESLKKASGKETSIEKTEVDAQADERAIAEGSSVVKEEADFMANLKAVGEEAKSMGV